MKIFQNINSSNILSIKLKQMVSLLDIALLFSKIKARTSKTSMNNNYQSFNREGDFG